MNYSENYALFNIIAEQKIVTIRKRQFIFVNKLYILVYLVNIGYSGIEVFKNMYVVRGNCLVYCNKESFIDDRYWHLTNGLCTIFGSILTFHDVIHPFSIVKKGFIKQIFRKSLTTISTISFPSPLCNYTKVFETIFTSRSNNFESL